MKSKGNHASGAIPQDMFTLAKPVVFGVVTGAIGCFLALLALAFVMTIKDVPSAAVAPMSTICAIVGAFVAGLVSAAIYKKNGYLIGIISGLALFAIILLSSIIVSSGEFTFITIIKLASMLIASTIGGMFGVNIGGKRKI